MSLSPAQLLAVQRVVTRDGADAIESIKADGELIQDLPKVLDQAGDVWAGVEKATERARNHGTLAFTRAAGRMFKDLGRALNNKSKEEVEAVLKDIAPEPEVRGDGKNDVMGDLVNRVKAMAEEVGLPEPVLRDTTLEVTHKSGKSYKVTATVLDVPATLGIYNADVRYAGIAGVPPVSFLPAYSTVVHLLAASVVYSTSVAANVSGDKPKAKARANLARKHAISSAPVPTLTWGSFALAVQNMNRLAEAASIEAVVTLSDEADRPDPTAA